MTKKKSSTIESNKTSLDEEIELSKIAEELLDKYNDEELLIQFEEIKNKNKAKGFSKPFETLGFKEQYKNFYYALISDDFSKQEVQRSFKPFLDFQKKRNEYFNEIITFDPKMLELIAELMIVANTSHPILLRGETGTGKELFAKSIHYASNRPKAKYKAINVAGLPEHLLESELFGYEAGAFTGASSKGKIGLIKLADKGTVFLDEIGDMSLFIQVKLLRVIENKNYTKVGGLNDDSVDIRFITATNIDLNKKINEGLFREDFYNRINTLEYFIPPLRDRCSQDKENIVNYILEKENEINQSDRVSFTRNALDFVYKYHWPGNVRQLINTIIKAYYKARTSKKLIIDRAELEQILGNNLIPHIQDNQNIATSLPKPHECNQSLTEEDRYKNLFSVDIFPDFKLKNLFDSITKSYLIEAKKFSKTEEDIGKLLGYTQQTISKKLKKHLSINNTK